MNPKNAPLTTSTFATVLADARQRREAARQDPRWNDQFPETAIVQGRLHLIGNCACNGFGYRETFPPDGPPRRDPCGVCAERSGRLIYTAGVALLELWQQAFAPTMAPGASDTAIEEYNKNEQRKFDEQKATAERDRKRIADETRRRLLDADPETLARVEAALAAPPADAPGPRATVVHELSQAEEYDKRIRAEREALNRFHNPRGDA